jgi:WD40 repeat protein
MSGTDRHAANLVSGVVGLLLGFPLFWVSGACFFLVFTVSRWEDLGRDLIPRGMMALGGVAAGYLGIRLVAQAWKNALDRPHASPEPAGPRTDAAALLPTPGSDPAGFCFVACTGENGADDIPGTTIDYTRRSAPEAGAEGDAAAGETRDDAVRVGRFILRETVGQGSFGRVYRAFDPQLEREVALKIPKWTGEDADEVERFLGEAKAAARLRHPNIVAVFESGRAGPDYFIASEFVAGVSLSARLSERPPGRRQAVQWVRDLARALAYAHGEGVVHRDIKPANVMIDRHDRPQLTDFGLAKILGDQASRTVDGTIVGTPAYMSPEQARGDVKAVGPHSDQYSLGVLLYELLTRRRPFEGPPHLIINRVIEKEPPPPRRIDPSLPLDLEAICLKAIEKQAGCRYDDVGALADDLDRWLDRQPVAARPIGPLGRSYRWAMRHPGLALTSGMTVAGLVLSSGLGLGFAAYYRWAAREISKTAGDLELKRVQLLKTNQEVEKSLEDVKIERNLQAEERWKAQRALGRQYRERGIRLVEQGNAGIALLYFAAAREIGESQGDRAFQQDLSADVSAAETRLLPLVDVHAPKDARERSLSRDREGFIAAMNRALATPAPAKRALGIAASPDGSRYVARFELQPLGGGLLQLRDTRTGKAIGPSVIVPLGAEPTFSEDSSTWLVRARDRALLLESATGKPVGDWFALRGFIRFGTPDGRTLLSTPTLEWMGNGMKTVDRDGRPGETQGLKSSAWLWDAVEGRAVGKPLRIGGELDWAIFRPDRKVLIILAKNRVVTLWRTVDGKALGPPIPQPTGETSDRAIFRRDTALPRPVLGPDGRTMAVGRQTRSVRLWDTDTGQPIGPPLAHRGEILTLAFSPDGRALATGGKDGAARLWDTATGQPLAASTAHQGSVDFVGFGPEGRTLTTFDGVGGNPYGNPSTPYDRVWCRTWDLARLRESASFVEVTPPDGVAASALAQFLNPDGPSHPAQWEAATAKVVVEPRHALNQWTRLALSPDGKVLVTAQPRTGTIQLWDAATGKPKFAPLSVSDAPGNPIPEGYMRVAFSPDGRTVSVASPAGFQLWDVGTGRRLGPPPPNSSGVRAAFSPDGQTVATARAREARFWDLRTGNPRGRAFQQPTEITGVVYQPDGKVVLTGDGATIRGWDPSTGEPIGRPVHPSPAGSLYHDFAVSPDSRVVMTLTRDDSRTGELVRFWDMKSGEPVGRSIEHKGMHIQFAFHPDGKMLLTNDPGVALRLWSVPDGRPLGRPIPDSNPLEMILRFSPDGGTIYTFGNDFTTVLNPDSGIRTTMWSNTGAHIRLWPLPATYPDTAAGLTLWAKVKSGTELDAEGAPHALDAETWNRFRQDLARLGSGPPR